jgi:HPt (histidine-containing phosphotransfer) domain-containing protein
MDDYISKPLRFSDVETVLARLFARDSEAEAPQADAPGAEGEAGTDEELPLIDREIIDDILSDGGREQGLLDLFVTTTRSRLDNLATAIAAGDEAGTARIAHSLKGGSAIFGAVKLAGAAARLVDDRSALPAQAEAVHVELTAILASTELAFADAALTTRA